MSDARPAPLDAPTVTAQWARMLIEELVRLGVEAFFVAPGSRSTPLTVAVAQHPDARTVLHVDERGTAFAALGWGRATGRPAAWITTSGTAVANGLPAAVEASVDGVPMVLLTADRPPELRGTGANQTVDQVKIYGDYVRHQVDVPPPTETIDPAYVLTTVDQAVHRAQRVPPGPVHLNCSFRKPLEPVGDGVSAAVPAPVEAWAEEDTPFTAYPRPRPRPSAEDLDALADALDGVDRGVLLAGRLRSDADARAVRRLATHLGWPLVPDLTSRLRLGGGSAPLHVPYADLLLTADAARRRLRPDAVLQVGGRFVSKRLRLFLREVGPAVRAVVRPSPARVDPDHRVTHHLEAAVESFVEAMIPRLEAEGRGRPAWADAWTTASDRVAAVLDEHLGGEALTEPALAALLSRCVPPDHALVAGNSMPVRDLNRHAAPDGSPVPAFANRGASGIDGTVATAAGIARGRKGPTTLLLGDLALWHDLNSLALLREQPVVVVVINNDGGGIFHFLPIREHESVFEPYFTTPQGRTFEAPAETFGLPYARPASPDDFRAAYRAACERSGPSLIEVQTDRAENRLVHEQLERRVAQALEKDDG